MQTPTYTHNADTSMHTQCRHQHTHTMQTPAYTHNADTSIHTHNADTNIHTHNADTITNIHSLTHKKKTHAHIQCRHK